MASSLSRDVQFTDLPENIFLEIFIYLEPIDKVRLSRTCTKWRRLLQDRMLWRDVDFTPSRIKLQNLKKLLKAWFPTSLRSLKLHGYLFSSKQLKVFSDAFLQDLSRKCPDVASLELEEVQCKFFRAAHLPATLDRLAIRKSEIPVNWLNSVRLSRLRHLDLSGSTRVCLTHIDGICRLKTLRTLLLNDCYRITDPTVRKISFSLTDLKVLEMRGCALSDQSILHIGQNLTQLEELNVNYSRISASGLVALASLRLLKVLNIEDTFFIDLTTRTKNSFTYLLRKLENLRLIRLGYLRKYFADWVELVSLNFPNVKIIYVLLDL